MKNRLQLITSPLAAALATLALASTPASAVIYYWDSNNSTTGAGATPNGTWGSSAFWSTSATGVNATSNNATTALDQLRFSAGTDATGSYTVTVSGTQTARQLSLEYGNITFSGGTINLSSTRSGSAENVAGGIVLASTAGNATISSNLTINGLQTINIASGKSLTLNTGTFTRSAGSSLNIITGTVNSSMTGLSSLTNGILGPWATIGAGNSTRYATIASGNTISGLTGTSAATAANVTDTTGALNYDVAGTSAAFGAGASVNTLRFTGGAGTMSGNLTTNGLLHAGSGTTTLSGDITIGSTKELVVTPASSSFIISGVLKDNALGASSLLVTQANNSGVLGLTLSNNNTYSGGTTVSNSRLSITANNALGTGAVSVLKGGNPSLGNYGGVVEVSNNITWSNNMTLAGQGYNAYTGALRNISGNNTHTGTITVADIVTRIHASGGTLSLNGDINLTTAGAYSNLFQHAGADIRLGGNITGSATSFNVLGASGGTNFFILDRAFAWGNSTGLSLGSGSSGSYGRVDLNGNNQTVTSLAVAGTDTTQNLITNRSGTLASFTINNTSSFSANPTFSGNLTIVKNGGGQATMTAVGTHTGGWIINNGTLFTGSAQTFGTGNVTVNSGGNATLALNAGTSSYSNNFSIAGPGSGNGALQSNTSGNYTISGPVALTGDAMIGSRATSGNGVGMILSGGINTTGGDRTLTLNTMGNATISNNFITIDSNSVNLGSGGTLDLGAGIQAGGLGTYNLNVGNNILGTTIVRGLTSAGNSSNATLNLGAANALGDNSSILQLGNTNTALEGITVNLNGNSQTIRGLRSFSSTGSASANGTRTVTSATAATLTIDNSSGTNYLYDGVIAGDISLTKSGSATQTLTRNNTYTGGTTVNGGALDVTSTGSLASGSAFTLGASATANLSNSGQTLGAVSNSSNATNALNFSATTGTVTLASLSGAGNTRFGSNAVVIGALNGGNIALGSSTALTVSSGSSAGVISGGGSLTKTGAGALELLGANTYSGGTTVSEGTLTVNGSIASGVTVNNGATLGGNGTISGATTIGGSLKPGNSPGLLTFANSVTLQSTASTTMEIVGNSTLSRGVSYDAVNIGGALVYGGTLTLDFSGPAYGEGVYNFNLFDFTGQTGGFTSMSLAGLYSGVLTNNAGVWGYTEGDNTWSFNQGDGVLTFTVVPEPNVAMVVGSLALMTLLRRRRD